MRRITKIIISIILFGVLLWGFIYLSNTYGSKKKNNSNNIINIKKKNIHEDEENSVSDKVIRNTTTTNTNNVSVPDTATDDDSNFIKVDSYTASIEKEVIKVGKTTKIDIKIYPKNASLKDVNFIVETSGIKVDSFGKVKGIIPGKYRIRVEVKNCPSYILNIEVR